MSSNFFHKLRSLVFRPDSRIELWARSIYHRAARTKAYFHLQNWLARRSYRRFLQSQNSRPVPDLEPGGLQPLVTFLVDCADSRQKDLLSTLTSILQQSSGRRQVILVSADPGELFGQDLARELQASEVKVIDPKHQDLFETFQGDFVIFCRSGDRFFPSLLKRFYQALSEEPDLDLVYYDCEVQGQKRHHPTPLFKPSTISPALCLSMNPFSRGLIRTSQLAQFFHHLSADGLFLKEYDACLRLLEKGSKSHHIPAVLVSQTALAQLQSPEGKTILCDHLKRLGLPQPNAEITSTGTCFQWAAQEKSLAIIIPSKNNVRFIKPLVLSLLSSPDQDDLSIQIVDNGSDDLETLDFYESIENNPAVQITPFNQLFNYSQAVNLGVAQSDSDLILLMNDDMLPINADWLKEMARWAQREEVGVVGAKLLRANHTLQHMGIILGLVGFAGHIYLNAPDHYFGLWGSSDWYRDLLAVTGACQMMRREVFEKVGGYDPGFELAFGDIDFCLRVHQQGYRNVYTPHARIYHYEGRSRGYVTPIGDILRGYEQFKPYLEQGDPYFSPNLTYTRIPHCQLEREPLEARQRQIEIRRSFYLKQQ